MKISRSRSRSPVRSDIKLPSSEAPNELGSNSHITVKSTELNSTKFYLNEIAQTSIRVPSDVSNSTEGGKELPNLPYALVVSQCDANSKPPAAENKSANSTTENHFIGLICQELPESSGSAGKSHNSLEATEAAKTEDELSPTHELQQKSPSQLPIDQNLPEQTQFPLIVETPLITAEPAITLPTLPVLTTEELKHQVPETGSDQKRARSRSPRTQTDSEITAQDGSTFILRRLSKRDNETSRYKCLRCKVEIQKKSIESHTNSKSHKKAA